MAQFNNLTDIIVQSIYNHAVKYANNTNQTLVYISICSHWRKALLALVYSHVLFIEKYGFDINLAAHSTGMDQGAWGTNIDLVKAMGNVCHIKKVTINIFSLKGLFDFIINGDTYFGIADNDWSSVLSLVVNTNCIHFHDYDTSLIRIAATDLFNNITSIMPNITRLSYNSGTFDYFATFFCTKLVQRYASKLHRLVAYSSIELNSSFVFQNLKVLEIHLDNPLNDLVSVINPCHLKVLKLTNLSADFTWNIFNTNDSGIQFTDLVVLSLDFKSNLSSQKPNISTIKAKFPVLRNLQVKNYPNSKIFANCEMSNKLSAVRAFNSDNALSEVADSLNGYSLDCVNVEVSGIDGNGLFLTLNRLFGKCPIFNNSTLDVCIDHQLDFIAIDWTNLSRLTITSEHTFTCFFELISRLPSLKHIGVLTVIAGVIVNDSRFKNDEITRGSALAINTSIRSMIIRNMCIQPNRLCFQAILYLLRRLPNISLFMTTTVCPHELHTAVLKESKYYPHLSKLDVKRFMHSLDF